jgi:hypothetical protein
VQIPRRRRSAPVGRPATADPHDQARDPKPGDRNQGCHHDNGAPTSTGGPVIRSAHAPMIADERVASAPTDRGGRTLRDSFGHPAVVPRQRRLPERAG